MALYKNGAFIDDRWTSVSEIEAVPPAGHVILDSARWKIEASWLSQSTVHLASWSSPAPRSKSL